MSEDTNFRTHDSDGSTDTTAVAQNAVSTEYKVRGRTDAYGGAGVVGHNTATSGASYGVEGQTDADASNNVHPIGVSGRATGAGVTIGVNGRGTSTDAVGVLGDASKIGGIAPNPGYPAGVAGVTDRSSADVGVAFSTGVTGASLNGSGQTYGVLGQCGSPSGAGVTGRDLDGSGFGVLSDGHSKTNGNHTVTGHVDAGEGYRGNVGASAYVGTEQPISAGNEVTVQYDTIDVDDRTEFDKGNYRFDPKYDGDYHVNAAVEVGLVPEGGRIQLEILLDGGREAVSKQYGPGPDDKRMTVTVSKTLKGVAAGDSIEIRLENNTSTSLTISDLDHFSHLEITQVG